MVFVGAVFLAVLSSVAVLLRFISRGRILHILGPTDWFIAVTLLFAIGNTVCVKLYLAHGLGRPSAELSVEEMQAFTKWQYILIIVNHVCLVMTKLSVLLLFLDVFLITWVRKATYGVTAAVILHGVYVTLSNVFICTPIAAYWHVEWPVRNCIDPPSKFFADTALNTAFDFAILFLPLPMIWSMTLPRRQKFWLCLLAALGFALCVVSAMRFSVFANIRASGDPSRTAVGLVTWTTLEINLGIIIACFPTFTPLAVKFCPRLVKRAYTEGSGEHPPTISSAPRRLRSIESIAM